MCVLCLYLRFKLLTLCSKEKWIINNILSYNNNEVITGIGVQCYFVLYTFPFMFSVLYQLIPQITELLLKKEIKRKMLILCTYFLSIKSHTWKHVKQLSGILIACWEIIRLVPSLVLMPHEFLDKLVIHYEWIVITTIKWFFSALIENCYVKPVYPEKLHCINIKKYFS